MRAFVGHNMILPAVLAAARPHIFFALGDDVGWANVGWHRPDGSQGRAEAHTPNLNGLAAAGIEISRQYAYKF
jgi:arylsulfatase A-like enzyme